LNLDQRAGWRRFALEAGSRWGMLEIQIEIKIKKAYFKSIMHQEKHAHRA
jgi:hypothetical protein